MQKLSIRDPESTTRLRPGFWILVAVFALYAVSQVVWLALDERPVSEERHYFAAARVAHSLQGTAIGRAYPRVGKDSPYPPLLAYYTGTVLALTRCRADVAVLSLLPFAGLLLWAVWRIGSRFVSGATAAAAAALVLCFHHFIDVEPLYAPYTFFTEYMLDLPLSALTATAVYFMMQWLEKAHGPERTSNVEPAAEQSIPRVLTFRRGEMRVWIPLGLAAGAAMLVKVSAPLYLLIGGVALLAEGSRDWRRWGALWKPALLAVLIALPWYLIHAGDIAGYLRHHEFNTRLALRDGMPAVGSVENLLYYLRALQTMLSTPFSVVLVLALICIAILRPRGGRLAMTGLFLSYGLLTVLWGKSWRFMAPSLMYAGLAIGFAVDAIARRERIRRLVAAGLVIAACTRMALMYGVGVSTAAAHGAVVRLAPVPHDGGIERIMQDVLRERDTELRLCMSVVPVLRRFRHSSFMQYAIEHDVPMVYGSEWRIRSDAWRDELERSEFIVTRTGYNGPARYVPHRMDIALWLARRRGETVHVVDTYGMADGTIARLYRHDREFAHWQRLPAAPLSASKVNFGDQILLIDCRPQRTATHLHVRCTWRARIPPDKEYRLFLQLRDGRRNIVAESFTPGNGLLPGTKWRPHEHLVETYSLALPDPPATRKLGLWLGWHRRWRRLPVEESVYPAFLNAVHIPME